jgi:hypothetical protein
MYKRAENIFYILSALVLLGGMFVLQNSGERSVAEFKSQVRQQFATAFKQVWTESNPVQSVALVWTGVDKFYMDSSTEMIAMLPTVDFSVPDGVEHGVDRLALAVSELLDFSKKSILSPDIAVDTSAVPGGRHTQALFAVGPMQFAGTVAGASVTKLAQKPLEAYVWPDPPAAAADWETHCVAAADSLPLRVADCASAP